ncbi:uncharacterized protein LOC135309868 [Plodia interpunctella]|uniref:uncharacterized protein LOC135309868 n=1 Tax=Plodia interpunctella TaxID=58824 RepID=UPI00310189F5
MYNNFMTLMFKEVNGTVTNITGVDTSIIKTIFDSLNASMEITSILKQDIPKALSAFRDLLSRKSDIFLPSLSINSYIYAVVQMSTIFKFGDIGWISPKLSLEYPIGRILDPLFNKVTPLLGICFVIFVIVAKVIQILKRKEVGSYNNILLDSYQIFLGQQTPFVTGSSLLNSMFIMWIWCSAIVRLVYESDLTSGLQTEIDHKGFENFAKANEFIRDYGGIISYQRFVFDTPLEKNYQLVPLKDAGSYIHGIVNGKKFIMIVDVTSLYQIVKDIDIVEKVTASSACFYVRPGWPGAKRFDTIIRSIVEAGLVEKVYERPKWKKQKTISAAEEAKPLKIKSLLIIFVSYIILILICFAVFIGEIVYFQIRMRGVYTYVE